MIIKSVTIDICQACLDGEGDECHTPGCALFLHAVDLPFTEGLYEVVAEFDDSEFIAAMAEPLTATVQLDPGRATDGRR